MKHEGGLPGEEAINNSFLTSKESKKDQPSCLPLDFVISGGGA